MAIQRRVHPRASAPGAPDLGGLAGISQGSPLPTHLHNQLVEAGSQTVRSDLLPARIASTLSGERAAHPPVLGEQSNAFTPAAALADLTLEEDSDGEADAAGIQMLIDAANV